MKYRFKNKNLLKRALTHRSYLNETKQKNLHSYERLEFLGDAVLELIVSLYLFEKYPDSPEGKLTSLRSRLVQTKTLSLAAQRLKLGESLKMSKGEKKSEGHKNPSILADVFEAVVGAIYKDSGFKEAYSFVKKNLLDLSDKMFKAQIPEDYKSALQEKVQAQGLPTPEYKLISSQGPDHNKVFKTALFVNGKKISIGEEKSKQKAETQAAKKALEKFRGK